MVAKTASFLKHNWSWFLRTMRQGRGTEASPIGAQTLTLWQIFSGLMLTEEKPYIPFTNSVKVK